MRIYLDTCCLQRPSDDQTQPRIRVESEAVLAVLASVQSGEVILLTSEALEFEIGRIPDSQRRAEANAMLTLAHERLTLDSSAESVAAKLEKSGLSAMDALHVALASEARADFFATTDDQLLRRALTITALKCRPVSILGLISEIPK